MKQTIIIIAIIFTITSCKKFVDPGNPQASLTATTVFNSEPTATSVLTGVYGKMMSSAGYFANGGSLSVSFFAGLSADEWNMAYVDPGWSQFNENALVPDNSNVYTSLWLDIYQTIYVANQVIENVPGNTALSEQVQQQLEGEGLFLRAFCHFYLVNLFGDVPLVLTTDHEVNRLATRAPAADVIAQVQADLEKAISLLDDNYPDAGNEPTMERVRPNKATARASLARLSLYTGQWEKAKENATAIIDDTRYTMPALNDVFLKNSAESIWQLQPVIDGLNTWEGLFYIQPFAPSIATLTPELTNAFEDGDQRKVNWVVIDSTSIPYAYPFKYKVQFDEEKKEYSTVFRLAEQYLIRAEANAQLGEIDAAKDDLNVVRTRAGLPNTAANDQQTILEAIMHERRVELFTEWGHRWFDLKRTGKMVEALSVTKTNIDNNDALYPVPQLEIQRNPLLTQNQGY